MVTANVLDVGKPHFYPSQFFAVAVVIMKKEEEKRKTIQGKHYMVNWQSQFSSFMHIP
jgi:hypothetical protein